MKVEVDEKNASCCLSCYCLYCMTPLMVIDIYSLLLSQMACRAGSRTSVEMLQRYPAIFCQTHTSSSWLKIHIHHLEHNIEYSSKVFFFELYTFTKCVQRSLFKLSLHPLLCTPFSIHFSRRLTLPAELSAQTILIPIARLISEQCLATKKCPHSTLRWSEAGLSFIPSIPLHFSSSSVSYALNDWPWFLNVVCSTVGSRAYNQSACRTRHGVFRRRSSNRDRGSGLVTYHASRFDAGEPIGVVRR